MPKNLRKKKKKRQRGEREEDWSDTDSVSSSIFGGFSDDEEIEPTPDPEEDFAVGLDQLLERRPKTRQTGFRSCVQILQRNLMCDSVANSFTTLTTCIKNSLRRGGGQEAILALQLLQCTAVTLGVNGAPVLDQFRDLLISSIRTSSKPAAVRGEACFSLGILCFVACDEKENANARHVFQSIFANENTSSNSTGGDEQPAEVVTNALTAWGLLASLADPHALAGELYTATIPLLMPLLECKSVEVRLASGELIALMHEARTRLEDAGELETEDEYEFDVELVVTALQELASDGKNKRSRSKKERKKQRSLFREVLRTVESGHIPHESLTIAKVKHSFQGWDIVLQLESFRRCLGPGLLVHLMYNDMLVDVFGVSVEADESNTSRQALDEDRRQRKKTVYHERQKARRNKGLRLDDQG